MRSSLNNGDFCVVEKGRYLLGWRVYAVIAIVMVVINVIPWWNMTDTAVGSWVTESVSHLSRPIMLSVNGSLEKKVPGSGLMLSVMFILGMGFVVYSAFQARALTNNGIKLWIKVQSVTGSAILVAFIFAIIFYGGEYKGDIPDSYHAAIIEISVFWVLLYWVAAFSITSLISVAITPVNENKVR